MAKKIYNARLSEREISLCMNSVNELIKTLAQAKELVGASSPLAVMEIDKDIKELQQLNEYFCHIPYEVEYEYTTSNCAKCDMCSLVTHNITGEPLSCEEQYYQCLAGMEDECRNKE